MVEVRGLSGHATQEGVIPEMNTCGAVRPENVPRVVLAASGTRAFRPLVVVHHLVVVTKTHRIGEAGLKEMSLLQDSDLPLELLLPSKTLIDAVRGCESSLVIHVGAGRIVFLGKLVIEPGGEEVFVDDLLTGETVF